MSALLISHGVKSNRKAHFPIRKHAADFFTAVLVLENKKWISASEAAAIKHTRAYNGGDNVLFAIHQLDILRKHERLLTVNPVIAQTHITAVGGGIEQRLQHSNDKTILYRLSKGGFARRQATPMLPLIYFSMSLPSG
jgi:hypothetical protein